MKICLGKLEEILKDCFEGDGSNLINIQGIANSFTFHGEKIEKHRKELKKMIKLLNTNFLTDKEGGGGGWSFLQIPFDKDNYQWGEQRNAEILVVLCMAAKLCVRLMPIEMDGIMPGGVPYLIFSLKNDTFSNH